ncbi:MAG: hypothetical protein HY716_09365 [Planctomycetes bacterium]|nr:hypothetical protein [Planctomycetota bacterium]
MAHALTCACGRKLRVPDALRGKSAQCPFCKAVHQIPESDSAAAGPLPPPEAEERRRETREQAGQSQVEPKEAQAGHALYAPPPEEMTRTQGDEERLAPTDIESPPAPEEAPESWEEPRPPDEPAAPAVSAPVKRSRLYTAAGASAASALVFLTGIYAFSGAAQRLASFGAVLLAAVTCTLLLLETTRKG